MGAATRRQGERERQQYKQFPEAAHRGKLAQPVQRAPAPRFSTLTALCEALGCQPADLLAYEA
ncbi:MAG: helix-turn-helix domain-containing protein [Actinomycetota bacterium]